MSEVLIRVTHPKGQLRININRTYTMQYLAEQIGQKINQPSTNLIMSINNNKFYKPSSKKTIQQFGLNEDGIRLYVKLIDQNQTKVEEKSTKIQTNRNCNHGPNGRCINCPDFQSQIKEKNVDKKDQKNQDKKKVVDKGQCNHGPNAKCLNCINDIEQKDNTYVTQKNKGKCDHGPNAKCLNCLSIENENVKHVSFDSFIDKNYAKCKSHQKNQKCNNCLVDLEFDYKIKKNCHNHEPYPKGVCSKCLPPLIKIKRQQYRHIDYTQFMNFKEMGDMIQYWLKNINQRVAYLYGYYAEDPIYNKGVRAVIETLYEPPQENSFNDTILLQDPFQINIDSIVTSLGLERVGWTFTTHNKDVFLSSQELIKSAQYQEDFKVTHPIGIDVSKQVTVVLRADADKNGQVAPEVYMVSDEAQSLVRDNLVGEPKTRKMIKLKNTEDSRFSIKFFSQGKIVNEVETDYCIVNVAHGQPKDNKFKILNDFYFPPANRQERQKASDVRKYFNDHKREKSWIKFANLHLLFYLSKLIDIHTVLTICDCIKEQRDVPGYIEELIGNYTNH